MPGGTPEAYQHIEPIVQAVAAQVQLLSMLSPLFTVQTEHCHGLLLRRPAYSASSSG